MAFLSPGLVGLVLSYALSLTGLLSGLVSSFTQTEGMMVSVERLEEYSCGLPQEPRGQPLQVSRPLPLGQGCWSWGVLQSSQVLSFSSLLSFHIPEPLGLTAAILHCTLIPLSTLPSAPYFLFAITPAIFLRLPPPSSHSVLATVLPSLLIHRHPTSASGG